MEHTMGTITGRRVAINGTDHLGVIVSAYGDEDGTVHTVDVLTDISEDDCEGHPVTWGPIGNVAFCNGACQPVYLRTWGDVDPVDLTFLDEPEPALNVVFRDVQPGPAPF